MTGRSSLRWLAPGLLAVALLAPAAVADPAVGPPRRARSSSRSGRRRSRPRSRADADKDRRLTSDELLTAARATFAAADRRKAGKLDEEEFADLLTAVFPAPKFGPPPPKGKQ